MGETEPKNYCDLQNPPRADSRRATELVAALVPIKGTKTSC